MSAPSATVQVSSPKANLSGRAAVLLLVVAVLAVSYASSMRAWLKQRSDIHTLTAQIVDQKAHVASLETARQRLHDPAYIALLAHQRFGWIMPGETGYRVIDEHGQVLANGTSELSAPAPATTSSKEWWQAALGTVREAGRTESDGSTAGSAKPPRKPADRIGVGSGRKTTNR